MPAPTPPPPPAPAPVSDAAAEHLREADRWRALAVAASDRGWVRDCLQWAQLHATLALVTIQTERRT